ncbi:halocyanin domain-containing protein [Natronomonas sp. EA1]|uniref:halocyanin domain-containing protein n=1 Tax=Natronomonas sp. EA1 TaxID=3421655 RepID=UPI003EBC863D
MTDSQLSRRSFVAAAGAASLTALAGCSSGGDATPEPTEEPTDEPTDEPTAEPTPTEGGGSGPEARVTDFLQSDPAAGNFDGNIADMTGMDSVTVEVGAEGNGGNFAFAPPAFRIDAGTTVEWVWTGKGGAHNVASVSDSDFDFTNGDPKESGDPYTQSFDNTGVGLYECEPHASLGMKGAFIVE